MSTTNQLTQYSFTLTTSASNGNYDQVTWNAYNQNGMTDAFASQITQALKGITPAAGSTIQITVNKQDVTDVSYATDYGTTPISFT